MAKEFFKNTGDAFKVLFQETKEAGKRFVQSEEVQKVTSEVKEKVQEFRASDLGAKVQGAVDKVGDELSHQVKKLYKVCPVCGRKMGPKDNYCASCGNPLPAEPVVWDAEEEVAVEEEVSVEETVQDADFVDVPEAKEESE